MDVSDAFYRQLVESSRDGLWAFDLDGRTLFANERAAGLLGRTRAEMAGLAVPDVLDETGRAQFAAHLGELRRRGENPHEVECSYVCPDGDTVQLVVSEFPLHDDDGAVRGYVHRLTADEDRQKLLRELSRSRQRLDDAQVLAGMGSWQLNTTTGELTWSRHLFEMLGLDPATFTPTEEGFYDRVEARDRERVMTLVRDAVESSGSFEYDARVHVNGDADDRIVWLRSLGRMTRLADGTGWLHGTVQDVTALKAAELELKDAVVLNTLMQVMATAANQARTLRAALATIRELLLAHEDWQRAAAWTVTSDGDRQRLERLRVVDGEPEPPEIDVRVAEQVLAEGDVVFEEQADPQAPRIGFPIADGDGPVAISVITARSRFERRQMLHSMVAQVAGQLRQVVEREAAARDLAAARDAAMDASRAKDEFLATMSHEIRTPMNGVIGLNELLLHTELDLRQRQLAQGVQTAGQSLLGIINNILDFSKVEAGELELEAVAFRPRQVLSEVVALLEGVALDREVEVGAQLGFDVPEQVIGDPTRLRQVMVNLAGNAVKFTRRGEVTIAVSRVRGTPDTLAVEVRDTGIGMSPELLERIFEPFRQADASMTRSHGGTGLGLAISRRLVRAMGGDIGVTSEPGVGSDFRFTLPLPETRGASSTAAAPAQENRAASGHVLVVEDNEINQMVTVGLLEALGYTSDVAADGEDAVLRAAERPYDLVLMDLQMPRLDGYGATQKLRSNEAGKRTPIIALTASATEGERERCAAAGMDGFLTKPVQVDRLAEVLAEHVPGAVEPEQAPSSSGPPVLDESRLEELDELGEAASGLVQRAVDNFVSAAAETAEELRALLAQQTAPEVREAAHRLKGSALNLGATRVAGTCGELERLAASGELDRAVAVVDRLEEEILDAVAALRARQRR